MGKLTIINDDITWALTIRKFEHSDYYYSYEYGSLAAREEDGTLVAVYYEDTFIKLFYPFIKREVPEQVDMFDIVTPYGYGGPLVEGYNEASINSFYNSFSSFCNQQNIITEIIRFHPLYKNHTLFKNIMNVQYIRKTTAVDLTLPYETIRSNYSSMNKRNIKKAVKHQVTCFVAEKNLKNIEIFMSMYKDTMDRNYASDYYYFDEQYFHEQLENSSLGKPYLLFAKLDDDIIAGVIVVISEEYAHYHLGASKNEFLNYRPNNLLFDFMIKFAKENGAKLLHLGGGYQEDDGLFQFKTSFSSNNNFDYYLGKNIHNQEVYTSIVEKLKRTKELNENYFPVYRGIPVKKMSYANS